MLKQHISNLVFKVAVLLGNTCLHSLVNNKNYDGLAQIICTVNICVS